MTDPAWSPLTTPVDKVKIAGRYTPGICQIIGAGSPRRWDKKDGYAWMGAWLVWAGNDLSSFSIVCSLYTEQDWLDWHAFRPFVLRLPNGKFPKSYDAYHPVLAEVGITSLVIEDVKAPQQTNDGEWTIEISCIEWRVPKPGYAKPDGAEATENDPVEQQIKLLREQRDALANEPP